MATKIDIDLRASDLPGGGVARTTTLATVNRVARLLVGNEAGLARIHRISNEGVELSSIMDLQLGELVRLDLSETISTGAPVISKHGKRYGLEFQQSMNCAELIRQLVEEARSSRARPLRLSTPPMRAWGRSEKGIHQLEVEDISQRGMRVQHDGSFQSGLRVCIRLPNGPECRGIVRWARELSAGLLLVDILSADDLGAISRLGGPLICPTG